MSEYRALVPIAPPPRPPRAWSTLFPLELVVDGVDVVATRSRRTYVLRGVLGVVLLPVLFAILLLLIAFGLASDGASVDGELMAIVWVVLAAVSVVWGIGLIALSKRLSLRKAVRFDRTRGFVVGEGLHLPFSGLELRVHKGQGFAGFTVIEAWHGAQRIVVHDRLPAMQERDVLAQVNYLAELVGAPAHAVPETKKYAIPDNTAAMLCYLPFQAINLIASLYFLFAARERPFVRFAAKQSLVQVAFTFVALIGSAVLFGVPLALSVDHGEPNALTVVAGVLLGLSLVVFGIGNLIAMIVACVRANRGQLWVMPWLRWILKAPPVGEPPVQTGG